MLGHSVSHPNMFLCPCFYCKTPPFFETLSLNRMIRSVINHYGVLASARLGLGVAATVFESAVTEEPANATFRYNLACVRAEMGSKEDMLRHLGR